MSLDPPFEQRDEPSGERPQPDLYRYPATRLRFPTDPPAAALLPPESVPPRRAQPSSDIDVLRAMLRQRRIWVAPLIVALNVAVFAAEHSALFGVQRLTESLSQNRFLVWTGEWWRLFTSTIVHWGFGHLLVNMGLLILVAGFLERLLGSWRFLVLYVLSGLAGALCFQVFSSGADGLGASGAVYGVIGPFLWIRFGWHPSGRVVVSGRFLFWLAFLLVFEQVSVQVIDALFGVKVASSAHLGGLACGLLLGFYFLAAPGWAPRWPPRWQRATALVACGVLLAGGVTFGWAYPAHDPLWQAWQGFRAEVAGRRERADELYDLARERGGLDAVVSVLPRMVEECLRQERYEEAVRIWLRHVPREGVLDGYMLLWDPLKAAGEEKLATTVLDELIASADALLDRRAKQLEKERKEKESEKAAKDGDEPKRPRQDRAEAVATEETPVSPVLLNSLAWWLALRGERLDEAKTLAEAAVAALERQQPGLFERSAHRRDLSACVNTLGWVELLLGEIEPALRHLREAVALDPNGANLLYLSWAYHELGRIPEAREVARKARGRGDLTPYERRQLDHLARELGLAD